MRRYILASTLAATSFLTMIGCSSSKVGAGCYLPYGVGATCSITTAEPGATPAAESPAKP